MDTFEQCEATKVSVKPSSCRTSSRLCTLFQILQTRLLSFQDGAHTTQSGSLQLFTPVQRISILHQTHVVFGNTGEKERG